MTKAPPGGRNPVARQRADQLVERVVAADILARMGDPLARLQEARGMDRARQVMDRLMGAQRVARARDLGHGEASRPAGTFGSARIACARLSIPHSPQPTGPSIARRRSPSASARASETQSRASIPVRDLQRLDALDLVRRLHDPLAQREADARNPRYPPGSPSSRPAWSRSR
jgi:hypothetical protein